MFTLTSTRAVLPICLSRSGRLEQAARHRHGAGGITRDREEFCQTDIAKQADVLERSLRDLMKRNKLARLKIHPRVADFNIRSTRTGVLPLQRGISAYSIEPHIAPSVNVARIFFDCPKLSKEISSMCYQHQTCITVSFSCPHYTCFNRGLRGVRS